MSSGTLSDRISALTLSVQESPLHNMKALETLLNLAGKRSRSQAVEVLGALKDLFGPGALLPSDRKLRPFQDQSELWAAFEPSDFGWKASDPLPQPLQEIHLITWAYEDWLKSIYFEVIKIIETWCNDEVVFARGKAVDYVYQLLREKPEQEANLLRLLVNKLGDSDKKVASRTSYNLIQLQVPHPLMKTTIISAIESDLLFRPGQSLHAKYYAVITLNQTELRAKQEDVTKQLLDIYFDLFTQLLTKVGPFGAFIPNSAACTKTAAPPTRIRVGWRGVFPLLLWEALLTPNSTPACVHRSRCRSDQCERRSPRWGRRIRQKGSQEAAAKGEQHKQRWSAS